MRNLSMICNRKTIILALVAGVVGTPTGVFAANSAGAARSVRDKMASAVSLLKSGDYTSILDVVDPKTSVSTRYYVHVQYQKPHKFRMTLSDSAFDSADSSIAMSDGNAIYEYDHRGNSFARGDIHENQITLPNGLSGAKPALITLNHLLSDLPFSDILTEDDTYLPLAIARHGLDIPSSYLLTSHVQGAQGDEHINRVWVDITDNTPRRVTFSNIVRGNEIEVFRDDFKSFKTDPPLADSVFKWVTPDAAEEIVPPPPPKPIKPGQLGQPAPDFTLQDITGDLVSLTEFKGKAVMICFWTSKMPASRAEMPVIQQIYSDFSKKGLIVLAISTADEKTPRDRFLKQLKYTMPILIDDQDISENLYGSPALPTTFIVGRDGDVVASHVGFDPVNSDAEFRKELGALGIK